MKALKLTLLLVLTALAASATVAQDLIGRSTKPYDALVRRLEIVEAQCVTTPSKQARPFSPRSSSSTRLREN